MKILLVGGTYTTEPHVSFETERRSAIVDFVRIALQNYCEDNNMENSEVHMYNGGCYYDLDRILNTAPEYDIVFWWANVPDNSLPKIRNVKEVAPHVLLVTSKRNDGDKYSFMELTQRALAIKANMFFEFKKIDEVYKNEHSVKKLFHIGIFDPLGCNWFEGFDITEAVKSAMDRLVYLKSVTRQTTIKSEIDKNDLCIKIFGVDVTTYSENKIEIPYEKEFIDVVRKHAETFYTIFNPGKDVKRFLGNASLKAELNIDSTRCMRGMPSFKKDSIIFVSQRNIDKQFISIENFVPCYMKDDKLFYCGDHKPSVDTPIQMRLYDALPNIKYMIHAHCYINDAPFTSTPIPCGAIEEVEEVLKFIDNNYQSRNMDFYAINLKGHGSLLMSATYQQMKDVNYVGRNLPETMF